MSDRFSPRPLVTSTFGSLRDHSKHRGKDMVALVVLVALPVVVFVSSAWWKWTASAEVLAGGFALLAGVLLAAFTQLASWRGTLKDRDATSTQLESAHEAIGHTLLCALLSVWALTALVVSTMTKSVLLDRLTAAFALGAGAYVVLSFTIVVGLLWDAYQNVDEETEAEREDRIETEYSFDG